MQLTPSLNIKQRQSLVMTPASAGYQTITNDKFRFIKIS